MHAQSNSETDETPSPERWAEAGGLRQRFGSPVLEPGETGQGGGTPHRSVGETEASTLRRLPAQVSASPGARCMLRVYQKPSRAALLAVHFLLNLTMVVTC